MINARLALLLSLIVSHASIASAVDVDISDNLNKISSGAFRSNATEWQAQRFTTNNQDYSLSKVTLSMLRFSGNGGAIVQIYKNTDTNVPEPSPLYTLNSPGSYSVGLQPTTFTANGFNLLEKNSVYWVVLKSDNTNSEFDWSTTSSVTGSGTGFSPTWAFTGDSGSNWFTGNTEPYQMRVTVQPVPEPSSVILAGLGVIAAGIAAKRRKKSTY